MRRFPLKRFLLVAILVTLAVTSLAIQEIRVSAGGVNFVRGSDSILGLRLGLDLEGGSHLVYEALPADGSESPTSDQMEGVIQTIERRVNAFGVSEPIIQSMGADRVLVQLPGVGTTKARVAFHQNVGTEELRTVLVNLGRSNALIEREDNRTYKIELPSLRPREIDADGNVVRIAERDEIQQALEEAFPAVAMTLEFSDPMDVEVVSSALGREDAAVIRRSDTSFTVELPSLEPADANALLESLQLQLPSLRSSNVEEFSFVITGGVEEAKRLIGQTARLELMERTCLNDPADITQRCEDPEYHVDTPLNLTGDDLARAYAGTHPTLARPIVNIEFSSDGARIFARHTQDIAGTNNRTAFFLDDELLIDPIARQVISGGRAFIQSPDFTPERVRTISIQLESGRLQVPLELIQELEVDATLGADSLRKSVVAGLIGLGLVLLFMALYYKLPGVVACIALIAYALMVIAIIKLWPITLTLGGIAAFILSLGMAVDANILIFERVKEELRSGRSLMAATETGFNRAWPAIRDSNVSTFITCAILFWFGSRLGTGLVTGFAVTLFIGVAMSMFSALTVTRTLLRIVAITPLGRYLSLYAPVDRIDVAPRTGSPLGDRR
jgi:preprotein translocase subunit SecD